MANSHLAKTLAAFHAVVHRTKNRLIAIPAKVQRDLGLGRRRNNHVVLYSIRRDGRGRWNHHLSYLTYDNELSIPADVTRIRPGDPVEVKLHRFIPDGDALTPAPSPSHPASLLVALADAAGADPRTDGSARVDDYLYPSHA
ncbi:MAG TPA: hypothetical protein VJ860_06785 [Polyangia bacterium]|jgi:hypothetical protein|nr:hypothetical protein [Polyangia bacterium]